MAIALVNFPGAPLSWCDLPVSHVSTFRRRTGGLLWRALRRDHPMIVTPEVVCVPDRTPVQQQGSGPPPAQPWARSCVVAVWGRVREVERG